MPLREIENRPGVTYDPTKKYRIFAEDLQGLDERITDLEESPVGGAVDSVNGQTGVVVLDASDVGAEPTLGFTPEDTANKKTTMTGNTGSNTFFLSAKAIYDWATGLFQTALGFTPENSANKENTTIDTSTTKYPTVNLLKTGLDTKQASLGFTAENVANKDTSTSLGTSDTKYPSQKAVKTYVDNAVPGALSFKQGSTTKNIADANDTQTIAHGLGVTPKFVRFSVFGGTSGSYTASIGSYNGSAQACVANRTNGGNTQSYNETTMAIKALADSSNTAYRQGVVTFDSTNITITWTKSGSPTGTNVIFWEAIG